MVIYKFKSHWYTNSKQVKQNTRTCSLKQKQKHVCVSPETANEKPVMLNYARNACDAGNTVDLIISPRR